MSTANPTEAAAIVAAQAQLGAMAGYAAGGDYDAWGLA